MKRLINILFLSATIAAAQSTLVQPLGYIPASQPANGLGFNTSGNAWEFPLMQAVGSTHIRFDCSWSTVEIRNSNNTSGGYTWPAGCSSILSPALTYGQIPQVNAVYGPPAGSIAVLNSTSTLASGAYVIPVSANSGDSLATLATACFDTNGFPLCEAINTTNAEICAANARSYNGCLVQAIDSVGNTITITAPTNVGLANTDTLTINQLLYAPIFAVFGATAAATNPSTLAYVHYAQYIGQQIIAAGFPYGEVGMWNEPPWPNEEWVYGQGFFSPTTNIFSSPWSAFALGDPSSGNQVMSILGAQTPVAGIKYVSNWTDKSGAATILQNYGYLTYTTAPAMQQAFLGEAFHPYGAWPEKALYDPKCIHRISLTARAPNVTTVGNCLIQGASNGQNFSIAALASAFPGNNGGVALEVNETGFNNASLTVDTRFDLRQFLGYQAIGISPMLFYKFSCSSTTYDWVDCITHAPNQVYTSFVGLMADIKSIAGAPITPINPCTSPYVGSYSGTAVLDTVTMQGARNGTDQQNSILYFVWQGDSGASWATDPPPAGVTVTATVPPGYTLSKATNYTSLATVAATLVGTTLTIPSVSNDPIGVLMVPTNSNSALTGCTGPLV